MKVFFIIYYFFNVIFCVLWFLLIFRKSLSLFQTFSFKFIILIFNVRIIHEIFMCIIIYKSMSIIIFKAYVQHRETTWSIYQWVHFSRNAKTRCFKISYILVHKLKLVAVIFNTCFNIFGSFFFILVNACFIDLDSLSMEEAVPDWFSCILIDATKNVYHVYYL